MALARNATAVHEASHAIMSFLLDVPFKHVILFEDGTGRVVPVCLFCQVEDEAICDSCLQHYLQIEPDTDGHAREIENGLWRVAAIAVAGQIGQECDLGHSDGSPADTERDRQIFRYRSCLLHFRRNPECFRDSLWEVDGPCSGCADVLSRIRGVVRDQLSDATHLSALNELATALDARAELRWNAVAGLLESRGVVRASAVQDFERLR